jgi:hypothetical protein
MQKSNDDNAYIGILEQIIEAHLDIAKFYIDNKTEKQDYKREIFAEHLVLPFYYGLYVACENSTKKIEYFGKITDLGIKFHKTSGKP